jgi:hypothetical protein
VQLLLAARQQGAEVDASLALVTRMLGEEGKDLMYAAEMGLAADNFSTSSWDQVEVRPGAMSAWITTQCCNATEAEAARLLAVLGALPPGMGCVMCCASSMHSQAWWSPPAPALPVCPPHALSCPTLQAAKWSVLAGPAPVFSRAKLHASGELLHGPNYWKSLAHDKMQEHFTGNEGIARLRCASAGSAAALPC